MKNKKRKTRQAFTLLELLVAMTIMAVITASLYSTLRIAFRVKDTVQQLVAPRARVNVIFDMIRSDLLCAAGPGIELGGSFLGESEAYNNNDTLVFYSSNYTPGDKEIACDMYRVKYALEKYEPWQGYALVKYVTTNVFSDSDQFAREEILCRGIYSLKFEYYDGLSWVSSWDSEANQPALPLMVRVMIETVENSSIEDTGIEPEKLLLTGQFLVTQEKQTADEEQEQGGGSDN
ncbi:MAG: prepilin-type N-terminal cleavage/methylation domain-containing protein [Sedimentisphaerales bacterium]|nr:prepilin-type N-terminal cleavage/methylation domain-containing protein [Sedimentisphaerales bacterium]MBN2843521.1 prepilin-type N-terminal cleavage/methylation domain-containing protein [Sedimentisphaerales bacterium]